MDNDLYARGTLHYKAYGQAAMNWLRGGAVLLALAMGYLCSSLLRHSGGDD